MKNNQEKGKDPFPSDTEEFQTDNQYSQSIAGITESQMQEHEITFADGESVRMTEEAGVYMAAHIA